MEIVDKEITKVIDEVLVSYFKAQKAIQREYVRN